MGMVKDQATDSEAKKEKDPSIFIRMWKNADLDVPTMLLMMKAGLPPVIALAICQVDEVAEVYPTLGYMVAITSILGFCVMPRAKFIQTMTGNVISICVASGVAMLQLWCGVQARLNTTPAGLPPANYRYNSSQSVVCGVWLFFEIWLVNTLKSRFPQFAFSCVLFSIFANISSTSGAMLQTTSQARAFVQRLLVAFLTGFAIATAISLFVFPFSCRTVVKNEISTYVNALRDALKAHKGYFKSLKSKDMFRQMTFIDDPDDEKAKIEQVRPEITAVKSATAAFTKLHAKLNLDLPFAKREIAYGKLTPSDLESMFKKLREIMMPLVNVGSLIDIFERLAELNGWQEDVNADAKHKIMDDWHRLMTFAQESVQKILDTMDQGLLHVALRMALVKSPTKDKKAASNAEAEAEENGETVKPGDTEFAAYFQKQCDGFYAGRENILRYWLECEGIKLDDDLFESAEASAELELGQRGSKPRKQRQLFLVLYVIFLLHSVSIAILDFVQWADEHDQATAKKRFITPGKKRFKKWLASMFSQQDSNQDDETTNAGLDGVGVVVYMGDAYKERKDPEHLEPQNAWQRFGNLVRKVAGFLRSPESAFGFRVACATMSVAVMAYLADTQLWFTRQRIAWAMLIIALGMTPTSGQAMFGFMLRIGGTVIAVLCAWIVWYMPDKKTPGVLVVLWIFITAGHWVPLKRVDLLIPGLMAMFTCTMIVGYELQVRKLGVAVAESNGQPYHPPIMLGLYRMATVSAGIAVAFFWTYFPYPITEHSALRNKLGGALYLSANLYSIMHEMVMARIRGDGGGDPDDKMNPSYQLLKARNKVFTKQMRTLQALEQHSAMVNFEFPLGGKFPKKEYDAIIGYIGNITNYASLLGLASRTFAHPSMLDSDPDPTRLQWFQDFRRTVLASSSTSHEITSLLSLLSSSVINRVPLPPYLRPPTDYQLSMKMEQVDRDILSIRHVGEPGYAAFAVIQISAKCIQMDIEKLLMTTKKLVGELDFSFHVVSTQASSETGSVETLGTAFSSGRSKKG